MAKETKASTLSESKGIAHGKLEQRGYKPLTEGYQPKDGTAMPAEIPPLPSGVVPSSQQNLNATTVEKPAAPASAPGK